MIEHLFILLIEVLARREQAEQQAALDTLIADLDRLRTDPAAALTEREVVIPPARHGPLSLFLGVILGFVLFVLVVAVWVVIRSHLPLPRPMPRHMRQVLAVVALAVLSVLILIGFILARRQLRGGELVMHRRGAEFRYRQTTVVCPWAVFRIDLAALQGNNRKLVIPIPANVIDRIELRWKEDIIGIGRDARIKPFRFISDTDLELTNVYAANLRDVARLLLHIGGRLG